MVEALGERKMALEEKVAELTEEVADLEALQVRFPSEDSKNAVAIKLARLISSIVTYNKT